MLLTDRSEDRNLVLLSFQPDSPDKLSFEFAVEQLAGGLRDENATGFLVDIEFGLVLIEPLEPRRRVDGVAQDRVLAAVRAARTGAGVLDPRVVASLVARRAVVEREPDARIASLTARERDVLALLAEGLSNEALAGRLSIGEATVKTHVARILEKLGIATRAQAVAVAYSTGFVRAAD